jgi:hypothetical protein
MSEALSERVDSRALLVSLRSVVCPACGGPKKTMQTLCRRDFYSCRRRRAATFGGSSATAIERRSSSRWRSSAKTEFILPPEK